MSTREPQTEVHWAIEAATNQLTEAFRRQDAAGCASLYTAQGAMLPPNADIAWGRPAIQAVWQGIFDAGLTAFHVDSLELESAGDLAYEMGRYTCTMAIKSVTGLNQRHRIDSVFATFNIMSTIV